MFHLYFGLFDVVLYAGGTYFALVLANTICDDRPRVTTASTLAKTSSPVMSASEAIAKSRQPIVTKTADQQPVST